MFGCNEINILPSDLYFLKPLAYMINFILQSASLYVLCYLCILFVYIFITYV